MARFFKTLRDAEYFGSSLGNRGRSRNRKTVQSPQGFTTPWMTKYTPGKGYWVKITRGKGEGQAYPLRRSK